MLTAQSDTARYIYNFSLRRGLREVVFDFLESSWQLSVHPVVPAFRNTKKKGHNSSVNWAMKRLSATSLLVRRYNSFFLLRGGVSMTALT